MKWNTSLKLENLHGSFIALSVKSTITGVTDINNATKGKSFDPEFIEHVSKVFAEKIYEDFFTFLGSDKVLTDIFKPFKREMTLESMEQINFRLQESLGTLSSITPSSLKKGVDSEIVPLMAGGHLADIINSYSDSFFNILGLKVFLVGILFLLPVVIETVFYFYALPRWPKRQTKPSLTKLLEDLIGELRRIFGIRNP
ncbi:MAG: hypothetical protein LBF22_08600 [Deltaproteobacteria bacterium]|nr:hypothetical protein [Deltaproteobacteria bacterium]